MEQAAALPGTAALTGSEAPDEVTLSTIQSETETDAQVSEQALPVSAPTSPQMITITPEQFVLFQKAVREGFVAKKVNDMGAEYTSRRNTLILRKVTKLYPDLVTDEEVVAYYDIYKMREAVLGEKKVQVKDEEVAAYLELWTGETTPSLEAIENQMGKKSLV